MPLFCCAENGDMRMEYGYARVSSTEQNLDRQILALQKYVKRENIVVDKQSGKNLVRAASGRCAVHCQSGSTQQEQSRY